MINERAGIGGTITGRGNRNTWRKLAPVLFRPSEIRHSPTWDRT
jgi:hypothetical protein